MATLHLNKEHHFTGHNNAIYALAPGRTADTVLTAAGDGIVAEWDIVNGGDAQLVARVPTQIFSLVHIPTYSIVVAGQMNGGIHVLNTTSNKEERHLLQHDNAVFYMAFDASRSRLLAAGGDGRLSIWSVPDFSLLHTIALSDKHLRYIAFSPDQSQVAIAGSDNCIHLLDADSYALLQQWPAHDNSVFSLLYQPDNTLISGSRDAFIKHWSGEEEFTLSHAMPAHLLTVNDLVAMPSVELFASAGRDKHIKLWDARTFALRKVISHEKWNGHTHSVNRLYWHADRQLLVSAGDDRAVMVWSVLQE